MPDLLIITFLAAVTSAILLIGLRKFLPAEFLTASVKARSNHDFPTPQTGGMAVVPAMLIALTWAGASGLIDLSSAIYPTCALVILFAAGYADDAIDLRPAPKLFLQTLAAVICVFGLGGDLSVSPPGIPAVAGAAAIALLLVWATNLTNFMDGLDLTVVAGVGVPCLIIGASGLLGFLDISYPVVLALVLGSALVPFAWLNRPPASMFLGDNGSLPVGLMAGLIGAGMAVNYSILAGLLPFSYFLIDTCFTLAGRLFRGRNIFEAHSEHAYQIARRAGRSSLSISAKVGLVSLFCTVLAILMARQMAPHAVGFLFGFAAAFALFVALRSGRSHRRS